MLNILSEEERTRYGPELVVLIRNAVDEYAENKIQNPSMGLAYRLVYCCGDEGETGCVCVRSCCRQLITPVTRILPGAVNFTVVCKYRAAKTVASAAMGNRTGGTLNFEDLSQPAAELRARNTRNMIQYPDNTIILCKDNGVYLMFVVACQRR